MCLPGQPLVRVCTGLGVLLEAWQGPFILGSSVGQPPEAPREWDKGERERVRALRLAEDWAWRGLGACSLWEESAPGAQAHFLIHK